MRSSACGAAAATVEHARRLVLQNRAEQARARLALERRPAGQHLEEQRAEREDIGARVGLEPFDLLRRHVLERAEDRALRGQFGGVVGSIDRPLARRRGAALFARPKSSSLAPDFVSITLAGFRSRCTMPERCAVSSASRSRSRSAALRERRGRRALPADRRASRLRDTRGPESRMPARSGWLRRSPTSYSAQMCG